MEQLSEATLLNLLNLYEGAIRELEALHDPGVAGLVHRMEEHRTDVIKALAAGSATA